MVLGSLITTFQHEIRSIFQKNDEIPIVGKWDCEWSEDTESDIKEYQSDIIEILKIKGRNISAKGRNKEFGNYTLNGRITISNLIRLDYRVEARKELLGGSILLTPNARMDILEGRWMEFTKSGKVIGSKTKWTMK
ncbi:hypothetical protein QQ008_01105 [Fulvivirgaceae bacterium BMA10]|uniref:Uncharacterized protein n=1 Tax=Splendidivirga corallicola TaxID=3051826 RepID=A0ABT8KI46_9BACT|nr:hypothetical protein [Fulvivirgaceae bacterium BMA10]